MKINKAVNLHTKDIKEALIGILVGFVLSVAVAFYTAPIWINRIVLPFVEKGILIQYTDPWESLQGYLKIVFLISCILFLWIGQNHGLAFLNPGLTQFERAQVKQGLNLLRYFFGLSILYVWCFLGPISMEWVLRFMIDGGLYVPKYIALTERLFQLIGVITLLSCIPTIWLIHLSCTSPLNLDEQALKRFPKKWEQFKKNPKVLLELSPAWKQRSRQRKWLWIILFTFGALVTPPDFFSLIFMVLPMLISVEIIWFYFLYRQIHALWLKVIPEDVIG